MRLARRRVTVAGLTYLPSLRGVLANDAWAFFWASLKLPVSRGRLVLDLITSASLGVMSWIVACNLALTSVRRPAATATPKFALLAV